MSLKNYFLKIGIIIGIVIIIVIIFGGEEKTNPQEKARKNAINLYEQMITNNVVTVLEKVPEYASNQRKVCSYKDGFLIEDIYNAEWYVAGNKIFAVNGLAKSLTPDVDYAPAEISYQTCY